MARKKEFIIDKDDLGYQEEEEECGFSDYVPPGKDSISLFSFNNDPILETNEEDTNLTDLAFNNNSINENPTIGTKSNDTSDSIPSNKSNNYTNPVPSNKLNTTSLSANTNLFDNRTNPIANGAAPSIDGETANIKRSYTLRNSTVRKVNELKSIHPDINICVSTIVDIAISYYHNHIVNDGGTQ